MDFVGKVMSLLFSMLSRLVIAFLPRSKRLLVSWLQSPPAVILEPKIKSVTVSIVSPSMCHEVMGPDAIWAIVKMLALMLLWELCPPKGRSPGGVSLQPPCHPCGVVMSLWAATGP